MNLSDLVLLGISGIEAILPVLFIGGFIMIFAFLIIWSIHAAKKRREAWKALSADLGLIYKERDDGIQTEFGRFKVFQQGRSKQAMNVLRGSHGGTTVVIADYQYTTGSGKNSTTHHQTLCLLQHDGMDLPHAFVRNESKFFDFLGKLFGGQDINFEEDPAFSDAFVLQGENEAAVREAFTPEVRAFFLTKKGHNMQFECRGDTILYHDNKRIKPEQAKELLERAFAMLGIWT